jgi:hypothetical protein
MVIPINRENYPRQPQKVKVEVEVKVEVKVEVEVEVEVKVKVKVKVTKNYIIRFWLCALCAYHNKHGNEGK